MYTRRRRRPNPAASQSRWALPRCCGAVAVALCWSQDDKYLLSCSADGRARLFDASRKIKEPVLDFVRSVHNFKPKEGEPPKGHCSPVLS